MKTCYETEVAGFKIALKQDRAGFCTVVYGSQSFHRMTYRKAAQELGESIMHALACEGKFDREVR